jgi:hypothetical protein
METLEEGLALIDRHIRRAVEAAEKDTGASPVMLAVLREFQRKSEKARAVLPATREAVVELEQAGDSARVAAQADRGAAEATRKLVGVAHDSICMLKAMGPSALQG